MDYGIAIVWPEALPYGSVFQEEAEALCETQPTPEWSTAALLLAGIPREERAKLDALGCGPFIDVCADTETPETVHWTSAGALRDARHPLPRLWMFISRVCAVVNALATPRTCLPGTSARWPLRSSGPSSRALRGVLLHQRVVLFTVSRCSMEGTPPDKGWHLTNGARCGARAA